jgi:hypothetical protein
MFCHRTCRHQLLPLPLRRTFSLSASWAHSARRRAVAPCTPSLSLSASWAFPVSSAIPAPAVDQRARTRSHRRDPRPRRFAHALAPFEPRPCPHSLPRLISRSPAPARALLTPPDIAGDPCPPPRPSSSPDTAPSHPELHHKVRHLYPCSVSPISLCGRPISASLEFGRARVVTGKICPA